MADVTIQVTNEKDGTLYRWWSWLLDQVLRPGREADDCPAECDTSAPAEEMLLI